MDNRIEKKSGHIGRLDSITRINDLKERLVSDAERVGLSAGGLAKFRIFGEASAIMETKQKRLPESAHELRRISGHLGKIGSNINQMSHHLNARDDAKPELRALQSCSYRLGEIKTEVMRALGVIR